MEIKKDFGRVYWVAHGRVCIIDSESRFHYIVFKEQKEFRRNQFQEFQKLWFYYTQDDRAHSHIISILSHEEAESIEELPDLVWLESAKQYVPVWN